MNLNNRQQTTDEILRRCDELEARVAERTADLAAAKEAIEAKHREVEETVRRLQQSQKMLELIIETIPVRVFWKDENLRYLGCNSLFARDAGYTDPGQLIGKDDFAASWSQQAEIYRQDDRQVLESRRPKSNIVEPQTSPTGATIWLSTTKVPLQQPDGQVIGILGIYEDITQRRRLESQLMQSQKMETVGRLVGGIAHEFNNILGVIVGHSEILLGDLPPMSPFAESVVEINKAAGRAATLTRQLLAYGRRQLLRPEALDLNAVVSSMEGTIRHLIGELDLRVVPSADLKPVKADAGQIEQVIVNIVMNAADAMPNGGKLTIETTNTTLDQEYVRRFPELKAGEYVMLAITDTGDGLSEEVKAHLFEPFFTTKEVGKGTGLGLSTCYGIVKQSGGHLTAYSETGRGTAFKIYLPQVDPITKVTVPLHASPDLPRGTERILVVEDDPALRELVSKLLGRLGYSVLAAADGIEALTLARQTNDARIDLLLTDIVMPNMSGKDLADNIQALDPGTKILFTSAYTEGAIVHQGVLNPSVEFLQKPFTPQVLAQKVRAILNKPQRKNSAAAMR